MRVIAWTMHPDPALGFELVPLDDLLRLSDAVSLHLRLSAETRGFLGRRELEKMKPSAILINTARGPIVDEEALFEALDFAPHCGRGPGCLRCRAAAGRTPIDAHRNVVLTPHSAGVTPEALEAGLQLSVDNVWNFLELAAPPMSSRVEAALDRRSR